MLKSKFNCTLCQIEADPSMTVQKTFALPVGMVTAFVVVPPDGWLILHHEKHKGLFCSEECARAFYQQHAEPGENAGLIDTDGSVTPWDTKKKETYH